MKEFYPPSKASKMKKLIQQFRQHPSESLYESWKRFKDLQIQYPHHNMSMGDLIVSFYEGLHENSKSSIHLQPQLITSLSKIKSRLAPKLQGLSSITSLIFLISLNLVL
ncbi:unnamed protein product [Cuscuta europaea]|uniref:Retrotransposon gag domain-containing protein n=1 Tax=Cuscuta europaea TaxID=41803 RepID=A0A9P1E2I6_CUSEU|nr:unnamed protein product [Cuscuta europaea]